MILFILGVITGLLILIVYTLAEIGLRLSAILRELKSQGET